MLARENGHAQLAEYIKRGGDEESDDDDGAEEEVEDGEETSTQRNRRGCALVGADAPSCRVSRPYSAYCQESHRTASSLPALISLPASGGIMTTAFADLCRRKKKELAAKENRGAKPKDEGGATKVRKNMAP